MPCSYLVRGDGVEPSLSRCRDVLPLHYNHMFARLSGLPGFVTVCLRFLSKSRTKPRDCLGCGLSGLIPPKP